MAASVTSLRQQRVNARALDISLATISAVLFAAVAPENIEPELAQLGNDVVNKIKLALSEPGHGRVYTRHGVTHQASAPGEPPAVDVGRLRGSYTSVPGTDAKGPYVDIGTNVEYAPYLEYGTRKMAARPHFRPALESEIGDLSNRFRRVIERNVRAVVRSMPGTIEIR